MFKFRGQRKDGRYVIGYLTKGIDEYYIEDISTHDEMIFPTVVSKESLSISIPDKLDSAGQEIFASFPICGVMTEGGDVVRYKDFKYDVLYSTEKCCFELKRYGEYRALCELGFADSQEITVIGKQGGAE